jgi:hypothetical protein
MLRATVVLQRRDQVAQHGDRGGHQVRDDSSSFANVPREAEQGATDRADNNHAGKNRYVRTPASSLA